MQVANERGFTLGTARLQVAHLPDGSTGFWASAPGGRPIATRLGVEAPAWQASLEVQGTDKAQVELECSTEGWQYSLDLSTPRQFRKGLRSVVAVQVRATPMLLVHSILHKTGCLPETHSSIA
jgi:hypothetical protein